MILLPMKLFFELAKRAYRRQMSYRAATIAGLATNFFWGILRAILMIALFNQKEVVAGMNIDQAVTYTGLTQAAIGYLSAFSWYDLSNSVYTGDIASDLLKPMGYFKYWLAQDLGRAAANFLTRGIPIILAYDLIVTVIYPKGFFHWVYLAIAIILSWLVSFSWRFIVNLPAFWIPNALGIGRFFFMSSLFFSGFLMPLRFFPDWVNQIASFTPYPHTINTVIEVYFGLISGTELLAAYIYQILWILILFALGQIILRSGVKKLVIVGG